MPETPVACINTIVNTAENQSLFTQISVGRDNKVGWKKEGGEGRLRRDNVSRHVDRNRVMCRPGLDEGCATSWHPGCCSLS